MRKYYLALQNRRVLMRYSVLKDILYRHFPLLADAPYLARQALSELAHAGKRRPDMPQLEQLDRARLEAMAAQRIKDWIALTGVDVSTGEIQQWAWQVKEENERLFADIVETSIAHGVTVKIVIPPAVDIFNDKLCKEFLENNYEGLLNTLARRYHIKLYNYRMDERFSSHYELFRNIDCLNRQGAEKYVQIILNEVIADDQS